MVGSRSLNTCLFLIFLVVFRHRNSQAYESQASGPGFVRTKGNNFVVNDKPLYLNGFNAYWLMYMASDQSTRDKVWSAFQQASKYGMNIARTWAYNDGGNSRPLQISPGHYDEETFKGLDMVISEARKYGIYVILGLINNYEDFGGRHQYVQWARERGEQVSSDDDFYSNPLIRQYYKNHVKTVLTRINTITGMAYKDDPTIFAWELINEPRSDDPSGVLIQDWIKEVAAYLKSIDSNHLLEIGLEGFYGDSGKQNNPGNITYGSDFILNNQIPEIDYATIHLYPETWLPNANEKEQDAFVDRWIQVHTLEADSVLRKPLMIGEFGKSSKLPGFTVQTRDGYFQKIYDIIHNSVKGGRAFTGGIFWQLLAQGMDSFGDGYQVVLEESPSTAYVIAQQSRRLHIR
ncbi:hypothetical protein K2173_003398 [Erythroxylum novogranatense]|uniref:mannan endo-1,4-beta-mannosidase n=1 Tax=Erythroxylum novogranatense TaxID=1862640 RepID=A0AAV8S8Z0_9ROSI|nr:hypothetical protein K2173_003398 [Erythroxylum novogranatense]